MLTIEEEREIELLTSEVEEVNVSGAAVDSGTASASDANGKLPAAQNAESTLPVPSVLSSETVPLSVREKALQAFTQMLTRRCKTFSE